MVDDEEWYGSGGVGINLSGSDWLGLGEWLGGVSQGTEMCGARPMFAGKDRDDWEECNKQALALYQQQAQTQGMLGMEQIKSQEEIEKKKRITIIVVVSLVLVATIVTVVLLARKRKRG